MKRTKSQTMSSENVRCYLSYFVTGFGLLGVLALAVLILRSAAEGEESDTAKLLLSSILPLLGTWVGTVLAYYFAKENFESAARATKELAGIDEKLRSVPATTAMIPIAEAETRQLKPDEKPEDLKLTDLITQMTQAKHHRLPVLDEKGAAVYIIHLSTLNDFVASQALGAAAAATPAAPAGDAAAAATPAAPGVAGLTIADLRNQRAELFRMINAWTCVQRTATLADAKQMMDGLRDCSDVFVTESGQFDEPVIGWITNAKISLHSKA